ncbi:hypothetical protein ABT404_03540 [Streptomyces hyaluromycini]|uniref:Uncharacterized protein n=1 Tax=Streptomyces hyaluromycini TaxID=1377993 RepID=A0ABV1WNV2_9ACTN
MVDQRVTRPGPTPPPRKLHLIYRLHITEDSRSTLAEQELDELPDGSHEIGMIEWVDYRKAAGLPIFPPIGPALAALADPRAPVTNTALPAVTDANYTWVWSRPWEPNSRHHHRALMPIGYRIVFDVPR